jgi:hypothetical protein
VNGWKRLFGVDLFDTVVHVGVSFALLVVVETRTHQPEPMLAVVIVSALLFSVRRYFGLRRLPPRGEVSGETTTGVHRRLDTEDRLQELESLYGRVAELEERVDFAERLLAQKDEPMKLESPKA